MFQVIRLDFFGSQPVPIVKSRHDLTVTHIHTHTHRERERARERERQRQRQRQRDRGREREREILSMRPRHLIYTLFF